jgi:hypothetical protein
MAHQIDEGGLLMVPAVLLSIAAPVVPALLPGLAAFGGGWNGGEAGAAGDSRRAETGIGEEAASSDHGRSSCALSMTNGPDGPS